MSVIGIWVCQVYDCRLGWSEKNFFGNSKKRSLEILANGLKIEKNRLEPVATYHGLATPQKLVTGVKWP